MEPYREVTTGWILLFFMIPGQGLMTYLYLSQAGSNPLPLSIFVAISLLFITVTLIFYQLRVSVWADILMISFGIGLIWKSIRISSIESIKIVKSPLYFGWGIRMIPNGTMYNISGSKAIEITFNNSPRIVRIGSKHPEKLKYEIEERLKILRPKG